MVQCGTAAPNGQGISRAGKNRVSPPTRQTPKTRNHRYGSRQGVGLMPLLGFFAPMARDS
jgi:hypothetical protein